MGDFHTTSMCRFMVATQAALWPLATAPAATRHRRMHRIIQTGHKTYRNFNKISIYLATVTPSLNFFIASPIDTAPLRLFPIIRAPDRMVHTALLHSHAPQLSKSIFQSLSTTPIFIENLQCFETHCLPATSFTTSTPSFQKNI